MEHNRCIFCMEQLNSEDGRCPVCKRIRWEYRWDRKSLQPFTVLQEKYLVGAVSEASASGTLYAAYDRILEQRLSVLEMPAENPEIFTQKAGLLFGKFDIPGLAAVKDFFFLNDKGYLVMESLRNGSLENAMTNKRPAQTTPQELLQLLRPVIEAAVFLHSLGIFHGQITAGCLLWTDSGTLKLSGFLAGEKADDEIAAPEQCRNPELAGPWTDVYQLCAVIYRLLTGRKAASAQERMKKDSLKPISDYMPLSAEMEQMVMQGLELDVQKRFFCPQGLLECLGMESEQTKKWMGAVRSEWGTLWVKIATEGESYADAKKENNISRKTRRKFFMILTAFVLCAVLAGFGIWVYCSTHTQEVIAYKLRRAEAYVHQHPDHQPIDIHSENYKELVRFVEENGKETEWEGWYDLDKRTAVRWNQASNAYPKFYLDKDTMKEAFRYHMDLDETSFRKETEYYSGRVKISDGALRSMKIMCQETERHIYEDNESFQMVYDVVDMRVFSAAYSAGRNRAAAFLTEVLPDICPETFLTEEEAFQLLNKVSEKDSVSVDLNAKCRLMITLYDSADGMRYSVHLSASPWMM